MTAVSPTAVAAAGPAAASQRITSLEGLRAVAALAVMLTHAGFLSGATGRDLLPGFLARLDIGVAVFFVLSGFLLYRPHVAALHGGRRPRLRVYVVHRAARLLPAFVLVLAGAWLLVPSMRDAPVAVWVSYLTMTQIYADVGTLPALTQLWSLATEVSFYAALPLLAWVARRWWRLRPSTGAHLTWLGLLAAGTWLFRLGVSEQWWATYQALQWLPAHLDWFALGMALAVVTGPRPGRAGDAVRRVLDLGAAPARVAAVALFALVTTSVAGPLDLALPTTSQQLVKHLSYGAIAVLVTGPLLARPGDPLGRLLSTRLLKRLGEISYGIFLWHLPVMFAVRSWLSLPLFGGGLLVTLAFTFAFTVAIAAASWVLVERPVLAAARRYRPRDLRGDTTTSATTEASTTAASTSAAP
jgi:peptidoglycan/LPS O-acetylase OafA/YrhL